MAFTFDKCTTIIKILRLEEYLGTLSAIFCKAEITPDKILFKKKRKEIKSLSCALVILSTPFSKGMLSFN